MSMEEFGVPEEQFGFPNEEEFGAVIPLDPKAPLIMSCYSNKGKQFIWTFTKKKFYFEAPEICLKDLAHGLSHTGRWTGQASVFMSVAQHSVLVSQCNSHTSKLDPAMGDRLALARLLHDGSEAYTGDISKPLKILLGLAFENIEARIQGAVEKKFGLALTETDYAEIKKCDLVVALAESRDLLHQDMVERGVNPLRDKIVPWGAEEAEEKFTQRLLELM